MALTVNAIGATGLVGRELVKLLLETPEVEKVRVFVRRSTGYSHPKLEEHIINFDQPETWKPLLNGDVLFSTLGTTLKQAGSKKAQYKIDYQYQYDFAESASKNGIPNYALVSSAGANSKSLVFYSKMKGELDDAVQKLAFKNCVILQPSILAGARENKRAGEILGYKIMKFITRFMLKKYRPIHGKTVARAMINATVIHPKPGIRISALDEIFELVK